MSGCLSLASGCRLLLLFVACTTLLVSAAGTTCSELPVEDLGQFSKRGCCTTENATVGPLADASGLTVPRLGAVLEKLGASKLVLIGDSLMEQVFDSLSVQIALQSDVLAPSYYCKLTKDTSRADNVADCGACPCGLQRVDCAAGIVSGCKTVIALPGGGQIVLIRTYLHEVPSNYFSAAALDEVRREWPEYNKTLEFRPDLTLLLADVVLRWVRWADTAVYDFLPLCLYEATIRFLRDSLVDDQRANPAKRHMFLATLPVHYYRGVVSELGAKTDERAWGGKPYLRCNHTWTAPQHWSNGEAAIIVGDALPTVDPYETFKNAGHMHSLELKLRPTGISEPVDCRHWCFSWSLFGPIWGKIASLAQRTPHNHARKLPPAIAAPLHNRTVDN